MLETKPEGAAVRRTERTEGVGSAEARELAIGPNLRSAAGSVGRAVMPASEALREVSIDTLPGKRSGESYSSRSCATSACRFWISTTCLSSTYSTGTVHATADATSAKSVRVDLYIMKVNIEKCAAMGIEVLKEGKW